MAREILRRYAASAWWLRVWPPFVVAGALWCLSSRPGSGAPSSVIWTFLHNGAHVAAYAALGAAVLLALPEPGRRRRSPLAVMLSSAYGIADEWHQAHVPGRAASIADLVSDGIGAAFAVSALAWLLWRSERGRHALPWLACSALLSVSSATWLPW